MFEAADMAVMLCADNLRVALATEYLFVKNSPTYYYGKNSEQTQHHSSEFAKDFGIDKPIALNYGRW